MKRYIATHLISALLIIIPIRAFGAAQSPEPPSRIIVIGDVHGDFDRYEGILLEAGLIDSRHNWIGEEAKLIQLGDVTDRGPDSRKIIDLLMKLEKRAVRRGGAVHFLLGNHEVMNMTDDLRYVHEGEYKAFVTNRSRIEQDNYFERYKDYRIGNSSGDELLVFDAAYREKWNETHPLGYVEHRRAWSLKGKYGKWAYKHDAVLKLGDFLFVHGGIGPTYVTLSIGELNQLVHDDIDQDETNDSGITTTSDGPLWYRGLAENPEETELPHLEQLLASHAVSHIVVGHTPLTMAIVPRFGAKVIVVDVGLSKTYDSAKAYIEIIDGIVFAIHRGHRIPLPSSNGEELRKYFETVRDLEPAPEKLTAYMDGVFSAD